MRCGEESPGGPLRSMEKESLALDAHEEFLLVSTLDNVQSKVAFGATTRRRRRWVARRRRRRWVASSGPRGGRGGVRGVLRAVDDDERPRVLDYQLTRARRPSGSRTPTGPQGLELRRWWRWRCRGAARLPECTMPRAWACLRAKPPPRTAPRSRTSSSPQGRFLLLLLLLLLSFITIIILFRAVPTLLYGYGGFQISLTPGYAATIGAGWLERGGAHVVANTRGGGEFGPGGIRCCCQPFPFPFPFSWSRRSILGRVRPSVRLSVRPTPPAHSPFLFSRARPR